MPLAAAHPLALQQLPDSPGFFLIRSENSQEIMHIGWAKEGLRAYAERLARSVRLAQPPASHDDLANRLWNEHRRIGSGYQISGARQDIAGKVTLAMLRQTGAMTP